MRYVLVMVLATLPSLALAQANALIFQRRNATDTGTATRLGIPTLTSEPTNTLGFFNVRSARPWQEVSL